jgi:serine protease Do
MRAGQTSGVATGVLGLAVLATVLSMPPVLQAAGAPGQQVAKDAQAQQPGGGVRRETREIVQALSGQGPRLGVQIRDLAKDDAAKLKLPSLNGVSVVEVTKDSAAERAGVKANDVIVQYDGENVRSSQQLTRLVRETVAGRTVKMALMRDGLRVDVEVTPALPPALADELLNRGEIRGDIDREMQALRDQLRELRRERALPAPAPPAPAPPGSAPLYRQWAFPPGSGDAWRRFGEEFPRSLDRLLSPGRARLGVGVQDLTPDLASYFGVSSGVLVSSVEADRPAAKAGLKAGDVITAIDGKAVKSPVELVEQLAGKQGDVTISVTRDKKALTLKATLDAPGTRRQRVIVAGRPV